jgi:hypothetical protein
LDTQSVRFAILLGIVTTSIAGAFLPCKNAPMKCQADVSVLLFIAWCCGVAIITFPPGPGVSMGDLYFGSWACFFITLRILVLATSSDDTSESRIVDINPTSNDTGAVVVDRGDILNVAYNQLEQLAQFGQDSEVRDDSESLFSSVESWSFVDRDRPALGSEQDHGPSPRVYERNRLELWTVHIVGSIVCLVSLLPILPDKETSEDLERIELVVPSVSLALGCFGFLSCMALYQSVELLLVRVNDN